MREKEGFRTELENIRSVFGEKWMLSKADVQRYTGLCYRSVCKRFKFNEGKITQADLARQLL